MATKPAPILDLRRLERQSMGDPRLRVEILALFMLEVERLLLQAGAASGPQERGERLHALLAVARNVGATRLAGAARRAEAQFAAAEPELEEVRLAAAETLEFLRGSDLVQASPVGPSRVSRTP